MKIDSSAVQLSSQHTAVEKHTQKETLRAWIGDRRPDFEGRGGGTLRAAAADAVRISQEALAAQSTQQVAAADTEVSPEDDFKIQLLIQTLEHLTGKKIRFFSLKDLQKLGQDAQEQLKTTQETGQKLQQAQQGQGQQRVGWGVEYDYYESHYESEKTTFSAEGVVRTQDGKEIKFSVDLSMSRQFMEENSISLRSGDATIKMKDPLVINFNGNAAQLTQTKFSFDIDSDGRDDQISFVGPGSGFLALDKNADGKINNGSELFGAKSGDGFGELAAYDSDGNQWIDENDAIYSKLRIWSKDENGQDRLIGLGQAGVGAIYLGHVSTDFTLKNAQNQTDGQIRSTGVYLNENGTVGTVQKVDLSA
jgi:hypothetical protein